MCGSQCRRLLLLAVSSLAVLLPAGFAAAACPSLPPPPCRPPAFTGSAGAHAADCLAPRPSICRDRRGHRGLRGAPGRRGATGHTGAVGPAGQRGSSGDTGHAGPAGGVGPAGSLGPAGPQGLQGVQGDTGAAGPTGSPGATGPPGASGPTGSAGPQGPPGVDGATGPVGATGPPGATGPAGANGLSEYAYVYNLAAETVPLEGDVTFSLNGVMTAGITHIPGAAGIRLVNAGTYSVTYSISGTEPSQFALFVNGSTLVPGTTYGSGAGTQQNVGQAIVIFAAGDVVTVRNHTSASAIGLAAPIGGTQSSVNASVTIEKLA